jgi:hypothetical protein
LPQSLVQLLLLHFTIRDVMHFSPVDKSPQAQRVVENRSKWLDTLLDVHHPKLSHLSSYWESARPHGTKPTFKITMLVEIWVHLCLIESRPSQITLELPNA